MSDEVTEANLTFGQAVAQKLKDAVVWLVAWLITSLVLFGLKAHKLWDMTGGSWLGMLIAYLVFYFGSIAIVVVFSQLDRIKSEGLKFLAQMLMCLLFAMIVGGVLMMATL